MATLRPYGLYEHKGEVHAQDHLMYLLKGYRSKYKYARVIAFCHSIINTFIIWYDMSVVVTWIDPGGD